MKTKLICPSPIVLACVLLSFFVPFATNADVLINEFVADNATGIQDEDNEFSDWIELKNTSASSVNLSGWHLTDNSTDLIKWEFPSTTIAANGYLIVFASSKNRSASGSELHTNFGLSKNGEYLALVRPDGSTIEYEFSPEYPSQTEDVSYGIAGGISETILIDEGAPCTAHIPSSGDLGDAWQLSSFNDSIRSWDSGTTGVGYETGTGYESLIGLDVEADMSGNNSTVYIRVPFTVTNTNGIVTLQLQMKCDDGFIAYINGEEVASRHSPSNPNFNSSASAQTSDSNAVQYESFDITEFSDALIVGENILAIHGLNRNSTSSDMLILPKLSYSYQDSSNSTSVEFLSNPTPGTENTSKLTEPAAPVSFSLSSGVYSSSFTLTLSSSSPSIYYTLDGSEPNQNSIPYSSPINISTTSTIRARSYESGLSSGRIETENYIFLASNADNFSSNLPIIIVDSVGYRDENGQNEISNLEKIPANLSFFEPGADGRTYLKDDFTLGTRAGIRRRGETSLRDTNNKPNLAIESWADDSDDDSNISPLGLPAESDWILWAPHSRDLSGLRNAFIYELSNQTGNYAVRTRFVEVFLNVDGGDVSYEDYAGFYLLIEKIKRDNDRVDVEALTSIDNSSPKLEGGYILRVDKSDPGQNRIGNGLIIQQPMYCEYPSPTNITAQQESYIIDYIVDFEGQLSNSDPSTGYPSLINVGSFVDHNIFNLLTKNADGLRYSTYMHKARYGKLTMGPIWDFDRSIDSSGDDRDDDPIGWTAYRSETVFSDYINYSESKHWWGLLFENADFWQAWIDRWQELRLDLFSDSHIESILDGMASEIAEARTRDIAKWGFSIRSGSGDNGLDGTQQGEVNYMKWWLASRMDWIDNQLIPAPILSQTTSQTSNSFQLTISAPSGDSIYYTLDGSDPRALGGVLATGALAYTGPITIAPDTIVMARAWTDLPWGGDPPEDVNWSGLTKGIYYRKDLVITEIHYNPRVPATPSIYSGDAFEFIELQNTGMTDIDLNGYSLNGGIEFDFSSGSVASLAPGDFVVIVNDLTAFESRYNTSDMNIAGAYTEKLSNGGENIRLEFNGEQVYNIQYNDSRGWPASADGGGHSLIPDTSSLDLKGFDILDYWGNWDASAYIDGSPGASDPNLFADLVVNEVIAHTDTGSVAPFDSNDAIELYNRSANPIVLDAFWFLSDDERNPEKWSIPSGTTIPAGGWVYFDEDDFHPNRDNAGFGLNKAGEKVVLSHRPSGGGNRIVNCIEFSGQANGASWGRFPDGGDYFQTLNPTAGTTNQLAASEVQITKLMYNPASISGINTDELLEYIQLTNTSSSTVALEDLNEGSGTWRLNGAVDYTFDTGVTISADEDIWLVPFDPSLAPQSKNFFCTYYGLNVATARLIGPYSGDLSDSIERLTLERPQASDTVVSEDISWIIVDEATWMDESPWPIDADGTGLPLVRIGAVGNRPESWTTNASPYYTDSVIYEKVSPGTTAWNGFPSIPGLSNSDYADSNSSNGVTVSIAAGSRDIGGGQVTKLIDGAGQSNRTDKANSLLFTSGTTTARVHLDLKSVQPVYQVNSYSWHVEAQQNQVYDLYYSNATTAPNASLAGAADGVELVLNGWIPLGSANSNYDRDSEGQIATSWSMATAPLNARHFLFDIKDQGAYLGEIDILTADFFVINGVPKSWLSGYGLPGTDQAALLDSDYDGQLNWQEYLAGTNPLDANSVFKVSMSDNSDTHLILQWNAETDKTYTIEYKEELLDSDWIVIGSGILGEAPTSSVSIPSSDKTGFFRISVETQ